MNTMKTKLILCLTLIASAMLLARSIQAANVTLAWDANPLGQNVTLYTVYELVAAGPAIKLFTVTAPTATLTNVSSGTHTYAATASNVAGESALSVPVITTVPALATVPLNLRATITATITITVP